MSVTRRKRRAVKSGTAASAERRGAARKKGVRPNKRAAAKKDKQPAAPKQASIPRTTARLPGKAELRKQLRAQRAQLSPEAQRQAAVRVAAHLAATRLFLASRRIACYLASDGEIDPRGIIERLWRMGKTVYLPVLSRLPHDRLWFAPAVPGMDLVPNRFGIPEPRVRPRELVRAEKLDLILLPLVAFDRDGNRLGRGAGFYDRSLAFLRRRRFLRKPHLLGLAHDFQRVPALAADPWDVPLDGVVTDRAVYYTDLS